MEGSGKGLFRNVNQNIYIYKSNIYTHMSAHAHTHLHKNK